MRVKVGKLDCLVREGEDLQRVVVLLHGFGADNSDLFPLAEYLDPEGRWTFYCPNAPLEVPIGPAWTGRGWFPISLRELEAGIDFTQVRPPGLDQSSALVSELIFELNAPTLVLGGFSQGAMVCADVAMENAESLKGLILYSGVLLDESGWQRKAANLKGMPFLQSHGTADPVLPYRAAQRLFELLKGAGADGQFIGFPGAHEIPVPVLQKTRRFLESI